MRRHVKLLEHYMFMLACTCVAWYRHVIWLRGTIIPWILKLGSPENRAGNKHFQVFKVWSLVPAMVLFLVVWVVKMWSGRFKKVAEKMRSTKITRYYFLCHTKRLSDTVRQNLPKTFESKLDLFWLKEPWIWLQKWFCSCDCNWKSTIKDCFENVRSCPILPDSQAKPDLSWSGHYACWAALHQIGTTVLGVRYQ